MNKAPRLLPFLTVSFFLAFLLVGPPAKAGCNGYCGDGFISPCETCDDWNETDGDGCSSTCEVEPCFNCYGEPSVCTYEGVCGNGFVDICETCDDANETDGDGCSSTCRVENCFVCSGDPSVCTPASDGTPCDDGLFCTGTETCTSGACGGSTGDPCPGPNGDGNCAQSCNEAADNCSGADPNGSTCDDGLFCTGTDTCSAGTCGAHTGDPCPGPDGDGNCAESCNEAADTCTAPDPNGSACDDGLFCTGTDTCSAGACGVHTGDPCPGCAACNEAADNCTAVVPDGSACDDGLFCTGTDSCSAGTCSAHAGDPCPGPDGDGNCVESCNEGADDCSAADPDGAVRFRSSE